MQYYDKNFCNLGVHIVFLLLKSKYEGIINKFHIDKPRKKNKNNYKNSSNNINYFKNTNK